jgi:hypothetical protein
MNDECCTNDTKMIRKCRANGTLTDRWNGKTNRKLNSSMYVSNAEVCLNGSCIISKQLHDAKANRLEVWSSCFPHAAQILNAGAVLVLPNASN